jgi:hypothetical protein
MRFVFQGVLATLVVGIAVRAHSTETLGLFEGVEWGAKVDALKKTYRGGLAKQRQGGVIAFEVVRNVASHDNAVVDFQVGPANGLDQVMVRFPKLGTPVVLASDHGYTWESPPDAQETFQQIRQFLLQQYGSPKLDDAVKGVLWVAPRGLVFLRLEVKGPLAIVGLSYASPTAGPPVDR